MTSMPANQSNKASDRQKENILEQTKKHGESVKMVAINQMNK